MERSDEPESHKLLSAEGMHKCLTAKGDGKILHQIASSPGAYVEL